MEDRQDITVPMPKELEDEINAQLNYGDSRAQWIRDAIIGRLAAEGVDVSELNLEGLEVSIEWVEQTEGEGGNASPSPTLA